MTTQADETIASADMFTLSAMAVEVPEVPGHPNRVPFSGVLTLVDEPSDNPPGGAKGKRVMIPKAVAEAALPSLLLMAVDFRDDLCDHDPTQKVGVITSADIVDNEVRIGGFLYGEDFPGPVAEMKELKDKLGFSYECKVAVKDWTADVLEVARVIFTGAAILFKDKAAYTTTRFEASASKEQTEMTPEELKALIASAIADAVAPLNTEIATLKAGAEKFAPLAAAAEVHSMVKPHADALRAAADSMCAAGIGTHPDNGHAGHIRKIADHLEASAVMGRIASSYDSYIHAGADTDANSGDDNAVALAAAADKIAGLESRIAELNAASFSASGQPERKTEAGTGTKEGEPDGAKLDADLKASGASTTQRFAAVIARLQAKA